MQSRGSRVLADSPGLQVVQPPANTSTFPGQKADLDCVGIWDGEQKKDGGTGEEVTALQSCDFSGLWLYHGLLGTIHSLRIFAQPTMMLIVHRGLQRSLKGVVSSCLFWPTFSIVNVPFLLCLGLTCCWVSYTIYIKVCFLCTTPGLSQSYL